MKKTAIIIMVTLLPILIIGQELPIEEKCVSCVDNEVVIKYGASALGTLNESTGINSLATGFGCIATGDYSFASGYQSKATGDYSVAMGKMAYGSGKRSIALGLSSKAAGKSSLAIGPYTTTLSEALVSIAMGSRVTTAVERSMVFGFGAYNDSIVNSIEYSLMIGFDSNIPTFFVGPSSGVGTIGKVGIGTTVPSYLLDVNGSFRSTELALLQGGAKITGSLNMDDNLIKNVNKIYGSTNNLVIQNNLNGSANMIFAQNGNIGIGTNVPAHNLDIDGDLRIQDNVGIGTPPSNDYALDVNGSVNFVGQLYEGGVLYDPSPWEINLNTDDIYFNEGNVGIGTDSPDEKLVVHGNIVQTPNYSFSIATNQIKSSSTNFLRITDHSNNLGIGVANGGNVGIKTTDPVTDLDIKGDIALGKIGEKFLLHSRQWAGDKFVIAPQNNGGAWEFDKSFTLFDNGKVGIGVTDLVYATAKLTVNGDIHAKEILVTLSAGGADFVFDESYELPGLDLIEDFIIENKHLPDIPSAKQMQEDGLELGDMQIKLLQKIEELTLYVIEQNKKIEKLEGEVDKLKGE